MLVVLRVKEIPADSSGGIFILGEMIVINYTFESI
jgi:hypothetical protein